MRGSRASRNPSPRKLKASSVIEMVSPTSLSHTTSSDPDPRTMGANTTMEVSVAEITARHFKADFNQLILDESHLADGLRRVGPHLGEPLGDASTIPSHLLAVFAREKVKVILSGEGARVEIGEWGSMLESMREVASAIRLVVTGWVLRNSGGRVP